MQGIGLVSRNDKIKALGGSDGRDIRQLGTFRAEHGLTQVASYWSTLGMLRIPGLEGQSTGFKDHSLSTWF